MTTVASNSQGLHQLHGWGNGLVEWREGDTYYLSVVFSWLLEKCLTRAAELIRQGYTVRIGGPAADYAGISDDVIGVNAACQHNPDACRTSTGCIYNCEFCIVPKIEGDLKEKEYWEPKSKVYDNNLTACSRRHFDKVIDSLKNTPDVDFNQGVSATLLTPYHASRFAELDLRFVRLAWDTVEYESRFMRGFETLRSAGIPKSKISVYILIGFHDTPEDALYRLETVRSLGVLPFPMRYQPLDTGKRNSWVGDNWSHSELVRYCHYWANLRIVSKIPFKDFVYPAPKEKK